MPIFFPNSLQPFPAIVSYLKGHTAWSYTEFLNLYCEVILSSPPMTARWDTLDLTWARRFLLKAEELDPDNFEVLAKKLVVKRAHLIGSVNLLSEAAEWNANEISLEGYSNALVKQYPAKRLEKTSGSSVIATQPPSINDIRGWSTAELIQHLEAKFPDDLDHEDLGILQKRKIRGRAFLEMTGDKLEKYGMEGGPAIVIASYINELKDERPSKKARTTGLQEPIQASKALNSAHYSSSESNKENVSPSITDIERWSTEQLTQHLQARFPNQLSKAVLDVLLENEIGGTAFTMLTVEELMADGIKRGPAAVIAGYVKELNATALLTVSDYLQLRPPTLTYNLSITKSSATTKSPYARTPASVVTWMDFTNSVRGMTCDNTNREFPRRIFISQRPVFNEDGVRGALMDNPDFNQSDRNRNLRLVIEVKPGWVLNVDDLVATYTTNLTDHQNNHTSQNSVVDPLEQIFGYLSYNHLQFGALTTYDKTWFLRRPHDNPGQLQISPVIRYDDQQPTLFQCFYYLTSLARNERSCNSAPPSPRSFLAPDDDPPSSPDDYKKDPSFDEPSGLKRKAKDNRSARGSQSKKGKDSQSKKGKDSQSKKGKGCKRGSGGRRGGHW
ncbi:hypothetical protein BC938DRAFT_479415 [Jimgerdemannia flammicorona]|uniref:SAM domain-containing protein n=1 Tax=Jimgerdemannia flammicorona TaxID=994334 RepID=A0A433QKX0_9FUNG|nr:hypothetical protein BC938DRAFT_479415 [Jimgerdemannia flammicorona]